MNTIPLIFNERQIERTVLGGKNSLEQDLQPQAEIPCAVILLNRGGNHYRQQNIDNLLKSGFTEIISVESSSLSYNLEEFAHRYPQVKFIIPLETVSAGDMINIGIAEIKAENAFVIWNDISITPNFISATLVNKIVNAEKLCSAPFLQSSRLQPLPVQMVPHIEKTIFSVKPTPVLVNDTSTIYPFDFIGIYNRQKFMQLGGYDYTITTPYWQNLDFSVRAWLWGEEITLSSQFKLIYEDITPAENITADYTQLRFFLKNCAPVFRADHAYIPKLSFLSFSRRYPGSPFDAHAQFKDARKWVETNHFRFKTDVKNLIKNWGGGNSIKVSDT